VEPEALSLRSTPEVEPVPVRVGASTIEEIRSGLLSTRPVRSRRPGRARRRSARRSGSEPSGHPFRAEPALSRTASEPSLEGPRTFRRRWPRGGGAVPFSPHPAVAAGVDKRGRRPHLHWTADGEEHLQVSREPDARIAMSLVHRATEPRADRFPARRTTGRSHALADRGAGPGPGGRAVRRRGRCRSPGSCSSSASKRRRPT
jgi:hypothetical protein